MQTTLQLEPNVLFSRACLSIKRGVARVEQSKTWDGCPPGGGGALRVVRRAAEASLERDASRPPMLATTPSRTASLY